MYQSSDLYFQRQGLFTSNCKCAVNNLIGAKEVHSKMLEQISKRFQEQSKEDYRHNGGDYDVDVIIEALKSAGMDCRWLAGGKLKICSQSQNDNPQRVGYLVNRKVKRNPLKEMMGFSDRHWVAVRKYGNHYYLLDSNSEERVPEHILHLQKFIEVEVERGSHLLQVSHASK